MIDRADLPVSWTNYIGVGELYGVFNHTASGYRIYKSSEYHWITRFRPNAVPIIIFMQPIRMALKRASEAFV